MEIEVHPAPDSGTVFRAWYIKAMDEYTSSDLSKVPNVPPYIWELIIRKATLEALKINEETASAVAREERHFANTLDYYVRREKLGSARPAGFKHTGKYANYLWNRRRR